MISRYGIFAKVIEEGSFTRTAELLGYSQSAVSQTVKSLEQELGTTLLNRGKDGVSLTVDGESYLPYIQAVYSAEKSLDEKKRELHGLENSLVRIGTFTSVSRNLLPQLMHEFKLQHKGVSFELVQGEYSSISQWVQEGNVDFGFVNARTINGLTVRPLYQDAMMAVFPASHPLAEKNTISLTELKNEPLILLDEGERSVPMDAFQNLGITPTIEYKVYDDYTILAMIRQGLGVSIMYELVLAGFEEGLAIRPVTEKLERSVALAWRNWNTLPIAARKFAEFILEKAPEALSKHLK